ncbi:MAG: nucleotidyltransferase domain-containing protein [Spirochaetales bacterium]|nr:nucleotidyltransferase domain-containing protein [Spirochaetales bacterium]
MILKVRTGSHLYGFASRESDTDFLSVFIPHSSELLGLHPVEYRDESTKRPGIQNRNNKNDVDDKSFSLSRFLKLLLRNNPNIIEVLFADKKNILVCEPEARELMDNHAKIVSRVVRDTFTGYAFSQKKKLVVKKERFTSLRKGLDYLEKQIFVHETEKYTGNDIKTAGDIVTRIMNRNYYREISEGEAGKLNSILKYYKGKKQNCESFHKGMDVAMIYRKIKDEYDNYGWRVHTESFHNVGYDTKFAYHLIRLLFEGWQLLSTSRISYPIRGAARKQILKIRNQQASYGELLEMYELWYEKIQSVQSTLREEPDREWANTFLIRVLKESIINEKP